MYSVVTNKPYETQAIGAKLGSLLKPGDFIALCGELGSGKTQFAKGVATGLDVPTESPVTSPTYTLMNIYSGRLPLYHFDLYRLTGSADALELGFTDYFYGDGVCLIEWAERLTDELPTEHLTVNFSYTGEVQRCLEFVSAAPRYITLIQRLSKTTQ